MAQTGPLGPNGKSAMLAMDIWVEETNAKGRVLQAQFRGIKGHDAAEFKNPATEVIITPAQYKSGTVVYPYEKAR